MKPGRDPSARWRLICELSSRLLDSPKPEWDSILNRECGADSELRAEVLAVCGNYSEDDEFFGAPVASPLLLEDSLTGQRIGAWKVLSILGEGGMGRVYLVERADGVFTQQAALKVIRDHSDPASIQRFHAERRILAMLEHPSIARAIDGGATPSGAPYLVMEYVEGGKPIDVFCQQSPIKDRIRLFLQVVEAVEAAHKQQTAHRDLKPANILVGSAGVPKVLDFGIAKLFREDSPSLDQTHAVHAALTPTYASPEQLLREPSSLLSDIYSLGAVLYRILTGRTPHDLTGLNILQSVRLVTESDPPLPSAGAKEVDPEVDAIVMKAMERSPANRYKSTSEFAQDLRRYLEGVPVIARQRTSADRARRLFRRRPVFLSAVSVCLLVALGTGTAGLFRWRAETQRLEHLRKTAPPTISEYQSQLFKLRGNPLRLDRIASGEKRYLDGIAEDAAKDPDLRRLLASAYGSLASYQLLDRFAAEDSLIKSMSHWVEVEKRESKSADRLEMAGTWRRLGGSRIDMGKLSEAGRWLDHGMVLLDSLAETPSEEAGKHERVIMLFELSRLSARAGDGPGTIEHAKKAVAEQEHLSATLPVTQDAEQNTIEVRVKDGAALWKKDFRSTTEALTEYTAAVATRNNDDPVVLSFRANSPAGKDTNVGNVPAGGMPDASGGLPPCASNVVGDYQWTTDNRTSGRGNGKLEHVGVVKLKADQQAISQAGETLRDARYGAWKISNDCLVTINWENGKYIDILTLSNDGKQLTGTSQIGTIITGKK